MNEMKKRLFIAGGMVLSILLFGCATTQNVGGSASGSEASGDTSGVYTWTFGDLATISCQAVANDEKDVWKCTTAEELAATEANAKSFAATSRASSFQFMLKEDVAYSSTGKTGLTMTLKSLDENGLPVRYGKWDENKPEPSRTAIRNSSKGCIQGCKEFLEIAEVQGPFTISITYASNANSDRTDRSLLLKIGDKEYSDPKYSSSLPAVGTVFTQKYTGTDKVNVVIGSKASGENSFVRIYDVEIKK